MDLHSLAVLVEDLKLSGSLHGFVVKPSDQVMVAPNQVVDEGELGAVGNREALRALAVENRLAVKLRRTQKNQGVGAEVDGGRAHGRPDREAAALGEAQVLRHRPDGLAVRFALVVYKEALQARFVLGEGERGARSDFDGYADGAALKGFASQRC